MGNSGAQAINLAYLLGARRILLLGFDMRRAAGTPSHWFGEHPPALNRPNTYERWVQGMWRMAYDLSEAKVEVLNGCHDSALPHWPRLTRAQVEALCTEPA